jgi:hypothetical protein
LLAQLLKNADNKNQIPPELNPENNLLREERKKMSLAMN